MPIPPFDIHGNLAVGDLFADGEHYSLAHVSLREIHDRFVAGASARRKRIWSGWMHHRSEIERLGIRYATIVDGSFTTTKPEPEDVDLCILYDAEEVERLQPPTRSEFLRLVAGPSCKWDYFCDAYGLGVWPFRDQLFTLTLDRISYWTRAFGIDRQGRQKSFLFVTERGVL